RKLSARALIGSRARHAAAQSYVAKSKGGGARLRHEHRCRAAAVEDNATLAVDLGRQNHGMRAFHRDDGAGRATEGHSAAAGESLYEVQLTRPRGVLSVLVAERHDTCGSCRTTQPQQHGHSQSQYPFHGRTSYFGCSQSVKSILINVEIPGPGWRPGARIV